MSTRVPSKKQTLQDYLQRGVAMVHLDARRPGVSVPPQFADDAHLRLNLSYRYSIPDFDIGDQRVQATLSFGGVPFRCILPWTAIFGITSHASGDGQVWPEDLPLEVMQTLAERREEPRSETPPNGEMTPPNGNTPARGRATLKAVEVESPPEPEPPKPAGPDGAAKRPHLRLVR